MRVLITNDDGIQADGLQALRTAVQGVDGVEVYVVAPDSNRSAMARSITTRSPLWVEEVRFDDGTSGYATEGTPVDCVRFADLGLIGERPDLILSGINHGANLGDDVTYSGTVAAALEGIVLGIPAIAVSQQSLKGEMGWHFGGKMDFTVAARLCAGMVERLSDHPLPEGILINVNCPNDVTGIEVTRLGKRLYDDEMRLVEEAEDGRRRYRIYGFEPSFEDEPGTDLAAQARGRISLTPLHFDLTYHEALDPVREWDLDGLLGGGEGVSKKRAEELRRAIAGHDHSYYVLDDPTIGDDEYDALLNELRDLEQANPELRTPDSPTQRVGGEPLDKFEQVEHPEPMLSLGNVRNEEELRAWEGRIRNLLKRFDIAADQFGYVTEPKIDGLAISLVYEDGTFVRGATRGDGRIGEDVTHNLRTIKAIPLSIPDAPPLVEVRGEIYFPRSGFAELNERRAEAGEPAFANPRNAAAGTIRQLDPQIAAERPLSMWGYGIGAGLDLPTHWDELAWMREHGFRVEPEVAVHETEDEVVERCLHWEQHRESLDYEIDGVVVKVNERAMWRELGVVGREPRYATAWKFPPITATTKLSRIVWNVGRTGHLMPFAMLEPVGVGGVTVSTATLHNEEDLARKDVREGDEVVVTRAGDVIPQVIAPLIQRRKGRRLRKPKPPTECPACGTPTVKPEDSVFTICPNRRGCPGQRFQHVKQFAGVMDIEGMGEKLALRFLDEGLISDVADIYDLTAERLEELEGFGETSARNLIEAIEGSKEQPFGIVLFALGLPGVGYVTAQALAEHFGTIDALVNASTEEIEEVEGVGPILAEQLREEFAEEENPELISKLRERGLKLELSEAERRAEGGPLDGKTLVITGTLPDLSREQATNLIRRAGGKVTGSVSKKTDYVVAGDNPGTKLAKAQELDVEIIDEAALRDLVGGAAEGVAKEPTPNLRR